MEKRTEKKTVNRFGRKLEGAGIVLILFFCVFPILFLLTGSLCGRNELADSLGPVLEEAEGFARLPLLPRYPTLRWWVELLLDSPEFFIMFWNSVKLTLGILAGQVLISIPAAWGLAKGRFPFQETLFTLYILLMMMPFQVLMLSHYLVLDRLHLLDTHMGIILPLVFSPFPVFIMYQFFKGIPGEMLEAARLDGAGEWQLFRYMGIPMGGTGIVSALVLGFLEYWNLIEQPMTFLKTKSLWPLSLYLPDIHPSQAGLALAASAVALVPALLAFLLGREYLEMGIAATAVRG